ncbi:bifunctional diaminohydroxyphosphoribosylaminopyrimidine deaminase/5-amino-6-(5-phosphoribosylamino)uracil reductase RibD [Dokdonella soli]|uniref:Riboflavin biosynthesis protein RibD n=1 Tax=Dokdonella soli TaxID=529810 RepID=A0ABN1II40_9GAMM
MFSACDHALMARALRLAECGLATTQPNPRVGCVIAQSDVVVGEGWHRHAGGPHAEVFALREAGEGARGATVYVTLEPCGLYGRTPPCADALIAAGVARVVIATEDAFQREGGAIDRLRGAGTTVESGLMREAARELNRGFFSRVERGRPWVRVKLAMSLDGRTALANGESKWITGEAARADVQRWRARSSAILTGIGTVLADDPALTVRSNSLSPGCAGGEGWGEGAERGGATRLVAVVASNEARDLPQDASSVEPSRPRPLTQPSPPRELGGEGYGFPGLVAPMRVVLDRQLRTPRGAQVLNGAAPTLLLHARGAVAGGDRFVQVECAAVETGAGGLDLAEVLRQLAARGMNEVQVEAGPILSGALFAAGLVDELLLYVAPVLLGDAARPLLALPSLSDMAARWQLRVVEQRQIGEDLRLLLRTSETQHRSPG